MNETSYILAALVVILTAVQIWWDYLLKYFFKDSRTNEHKSLRKRLLVLTLLIFILNQCVSVVSNYQKERQSRTEREYLTKQIATLNSNQTNLVQKFDKERQELNAQIGRLTEQLAILNSNAPAPSRGSLTPHDQGPITDDAGHGIHFDGETSIIEFWSPIGHALFPFGKNVPFWISKSREGLLINAEVKSADGKVMAELVNSEWRVNPHNYFKLNYDKSGLEIIDDYNIPWLQVDYLTPHSLRIGGVFRGGDRVSPKTFDNFTNDSPEMATIAVPSGAVVIIGDGQLVMHSISVDTEPQRQAFANEVREITQPWFDYTPLKGVGARLPPEPKVTRDPSIEIPSSPVSGILAGQSFRCDKAILKILGGSLTLSQGSDSANRVEFSLKLNINFDPARGWLIPINQEIPVTGVNLYWKSGDTAKNDFLRRNSVVSVRFGEVSTNHMLGKLYLESSRKQQTKLLGTFEAEIQQ